MAVDRDRGVTGGCSQFTFSAAEVHACTLTHTHTHKGERKTVLSFLIAFQVISHNTKLFTSRAISDAQSMCLVLCSMS